MPADPQAPRIRWQPRDTKNGTNPDWLWVEQRWKDEADYYGEELTFEQVDEMVDCPICPAKAGEGCRGGRGTLIGDPHHQRRRLAGEQELERHGTRFTKT